MASNEQQKDFKETFDLYDLDMTGFLSKDNAKEIISSFGFIITNEEMESIIKNNKVAYNDLLGFFKDKMKQPKNNSLLQSFQALLSKKTGKLSAVKFKRYLIHFGLKFTEEEAEEVLKSFQIDSDGNINYDKFIQQMNDS